MNGDKRYERYDRQLRLKEFGEQGQLKLLQAKVLVIGAGGLGCPALQYLTAAGIGTLGIVDNDKVAVHNLHRQPLYSVADIGLLKAETAANKLRELNPEIKVIAYNERITTLNALEIIVGYDIVIDGSDNFPTRYLVNDACVLLNKPLVFGAISASEGQLAVLNCGSPLINYRDIFPFAPAEGEVLSCAETGVLGVLPGVIGAMMANETIKLIAGIGKPLINRLVTWNAMTNQVYEISLQPSKDAHRHIPPTKQAFRTAIYEQSCLPVDSFSEIDNEVFDQLIGKAGTVLIDVREEHEYPLVDEFEHTNIPLSVFRQANLEKDIDTVVVFCQSGQRSREAARYLSSLKKDTWHIFNLKEGIVQWKQYKKQKEQVSQ